MEDTNAMALVFTRNAFYKRLHYLALGVFGLGLIVIVVLFTIIMHIYRNPTTPLYFATDEIGRLIRIIPVNQPNMSVKDVTAWAIEAVQAAYSFDYVNYRGQLQESQKYFTDYGWTQYMKALVSSNNLVAVTERKYVAVATVVDTPKLVTQGLLRGKYAWKFEIPLLVTYSPPPYDAKSQYSNALTVSIIVQRQEILQSYKGLGIAQTIGTPAALQANAPAVTNTPTP